SAMAQPLKWEFPGGKVEPGEDEAEAIVREIREELDLEIEVVARLDPVEYDYPDFRIRLIPFTARLTGGSLRLAEHTDARWVSTAELKQLDWAPADLPIVERLCAAESD